jgi:hypothetical protein
LVDAVADDSAGKWSPESPTSRQGNQAALDATIEYHRWQQAPPAASNCLSPAKNQLAASDISTRSAAASALRPTAFRCA